MWSRFVPDMGESDFSLVAEFCEFTDDALRDLVVIVCACGVVLVQPTCLCPLLDFSLLSCPQLLWCYYCGEQQLWLSLGQL